MPAPSIPGTSRRDAPIIGRCDRKSARSDGSPRSVRWDGHAWQSVALPPGLRYPQVVSGTSPGNVSENRVFAVGGNPSYDEDGQAWIWTRS